MGYEVLWTTALLRVKIWLFEYVVSICIKLHNIELQRAVTFKLEF